LPYLVEIEQGNEVTVVHIPVRGELPARLGPSVQAVPAYGPSVMDASVYRDPTRFELERERVLARHWMIAGRGEQVQGTGDWITYEGHDECIVVVRQADGSLSAFHNVCRHRGPAFVAEKTGCGARRFSCPYHGWVYDTKGKLVGIPEREDFGADHVADIGAIPVAVGEWGGWVWINLAGPDNAVPLLESIGPDISSDLGAFKMEDMILHDVVEWDVPINYKTIVDGFNEIYHVTELHHSPPEFTKATRFASFHVTGDNFMCFVPRPASLDELSSESYDHHRNSICHYVVFPNTVFNCNPEHIQVFQPIPLAVDRTKFLCWELIYPGDQSDPEYAAYYKKTMAHWEVLKGVVGEDISIYDQMTRTKKSSAFTEQILSEREFKIAMYHQNMDRKIRD